MNFNRKLLKRLLLFLGVVAPGAFALRMFSYFSELEVTTGFFKNNGTACMIYNGIGFLVFGLCLIFTRSKKETPAESTDPDNADLFSDDTILVHETRVYGPEKDFPELFHQGFAKKTVVWEGTASAFATLLPGFGFISYALTFITDSTLIGDPYHIILIALSLLSGLFFLLTAFRNSARIRKSMAFFGLLPALWCTLRMVIEYRDLARFVNKTLYIGQFLFIISLLVFFLYQAQFLLGEKTLFAPNAYTFSAVSVVFFGITARLPHLFAMLGDRTSMNLVDATSLLMDLAITLFAFIKLRAIVKTRNFS